MQFTLPRSEMLLREWASVRGDRPFVLGIFAFLLRSVVRVVEYLLLLIHVATTASSSVGIGIVRTCTSVVAEDFVVGLDGLLLSLSH